MIKDKKSLKATTPSRRKFFKAAAVTGAAAALVAWRAARGANTPRRGCEHQPAAGEHQ